MTYFTPAIDKYFASWILPDTWYTSHDDDLAKFYRFVIAIDHFSKRKKNPPLDLNDPCLAEYPERSRPKMARVATGHSRNPRTYEERALKEKILLAVERNHPDFDKTSATEFINRYVEKAMIMLDALWLVKEIGFPNREIRRWEPPLQ